MLHQLMLLIVASSARAYVSIVTGGNGFVGRHVAYSLLQQHYDRTIPQEEGISRETIVCLVRPDKVSHEESYWDAHVMEMRQSSQKHDESVCVKVMPYDMLDNGKTLDDALESVIKEVDASRSNPICIYHIASVFGPTPNPIETAKENVQSAEDVVRTIDKFYQRHPNSKPRLVLTSSMAAVRATDQTPLNGKYYTHLDWNTQSELNADNWGSCYQWSKAESERRAWDLVKECNEKYEKEDQIEMVALCPSFVFGPPPPMPSIMKDMANSTSGSSSYSLTLINQWLKGKSQVQSRLCADVRDVAEAHLAAGRLDRLPSGNIDRRYILSTEERLSSELTAQALIRGVERAPAMNGGDISIDMSKITCDTQFTGGAIKIGDREVEASERLERDLGVVCRPVEETMKDMAEASQFGDTF